MKNEKLPGGTIKSTNPVRSTSTLARWFKGVMLGVFLIFQGAVFQVSAQSEVKQVGLAQKLIPGVPVPFTIKIREKHSFVIQCEAGWYFMVEADQSHTKVGLSLFRPDGSPIQLNGSWTAGPKRVAWVAECPGEYVVQVSGDESPVPVQTQVCLKNVHPATAEERQWFAGFSKAHAQLMEAGTLFFAGKWQPCVELNLAAIELFKEIGDQYMVAETLWGLGTKYSYRGDHQTAVQYFDQALQMARSHKYRWLEAYVLYYWGDSLNTAGEYPESIEKFSQALAIAEELKNLIQMTQLVISAGESWYYLGDYQKAIEQYERGIDYATQTGCRIAKGWAGNMLGRVYFSLGQWDQAAAIYARSLEDYQAVNDPRGQGVTLICLGELSNIQGNYQRALEYFDQALPFVKIRENDILSQARIHMLRGVAYTNLSNFDKASEMFTLALGMYSDTQNRFGKARTLHHLGLMYLASGQVAEARRSLHEALTLRRAIGDRQGISETLFSLAQLENQAGNLAVAAGFLAEAIPLIEFLRAHIAQPNLRVAHLANTHEYFERYIDILMRLDRLDSGKGYAEKALQLSEQSRARELLDLLTDARAEIHGGIDPKLKERGHKLNEQLNQKFSHQIRLYSGNPTQSQIETLNSEIETLTRDLQMVEAEIRRQNPQSVTLTQPTPPGVAEIRRLLDAETALLEFQLGAERSYLWVIDQTSIKTFELPGKEAIESGIQRFQMAITARTQSIRFETLDKKAARLAQADQECTLILEHLSRQLLGQLPSPMIWKRLVIVPDGGLHYLPFSAVPVPPHLTSQRLARNVKALPDHLRAPRHPLLVDDHEVVVLPSAATLVQLRQKPMSSGFTQRPILVFADPVFDVRDPRVSHQGAFAQKRPSASTQEPSKSWEVLWSAAREVGFDGKFLRLPRLIHTRDEALGIAGLVPPGKCRQVLDFDASYSQVVNLELSQFSTIHFATHGFLPPQSPECAGIVLSLVDKEGHPCDGFLGVPQIFNLRLNAELVVLSGCRTGLGKQIKGEGIVGLTRSLMYAGARRVAVSLWDIHDEATAALMIHFYRELLVNHQSPAAALRAAQLALRSSKRWASPYFWSGFILQGEFR